MDIFFLIIASLFFTLAIAYVFGCARIQEGDHE